jgi:hypothetical protein
LASLGSSIICISHTIILIHISAGIISSLAFSLSSPTPFYAAGTFSPTQAPIALYDASVDEAVMYLGLGHNEKRKMNGGVSQVPLFF